MKFELLFSSLLVSAFVQAQDTSGKAEVTNGKSPWIITALLRKGLDTKDDKDKHALLSLTWPQDDKENSYLVNAALGLNFVHRKHSSKNTRHRRLELTPTFTLNRNNQINKEQHNEKFSLAAEYLKGWLDVASNTHSFLNIYPTVQYLNNKKDTTRSFLATAYFTWVAKTKNNFLLNNYRNFGDAPWLIFLGPAIGFEYQDRFDVKKPTMEGAVFRFYFNTEFRLAYKAGGALGFKRFELIANYTGREELSSTLTAKEGYIYFFKSELNYFPVNSEAIAIGLSYNEGQDPVAAIEKQKFLQLAFKLKLDYPFK